MEYKFAFAINDKKGTFSSTHGLAIDQFGKLIETMGEAIAANDGSSCTLTDIKRVQKLGYTPIFTTPSKKLYDNFISVHEIIREREFEELRGREEKYARMLNNILHRGMYFETFDSKFKRITKIAQGEIGMPIDSYYNIGEVTGIITEIGAMDLNRRTHIILAGTDYKIYTNTSQDMELKSYYRSGIVTLKVRQKIAIKSGRIISSELIDFIAKTSGGLIENIGKLKPSDLSFLPDFKSQDDILKFLRNAS